MQVDIHLNFIGKFEVPYGSIEEEPEEVPERTSKKSYAKIDPFRFLHCLARFLGLGLAIVFIFGTV